jgi:hypothetical protein
MYIHTYNYVRTYIHTYVLTYIHTYVHTYIHTYIYTYVCTYVHSYMRAHTRTYMLSVICSAVSSSPTYINIRIIIVKLWFSITNYAWKFRVQYCFRASLLTFESVPVTFQISCNRKHAYFGRICTFITLDSTNCIIVRFCTGCCFIHTKIRGTSVPLSAKSQAIEPHDMWWNIRTIRKCTVILKANLSTM